MNKIEVDLDICIDLRNTCPGCGRYYDSITSDGIRYCSLHDDEDDIEDKRKLRRYRYE